MKERAPLASNSSLASDQRKRDSSSRLFSPVQLRKCFAQIRSKEREREREGLTKTHLTYSPYRELTVLAFILPFLHLEARKEEHLPRLESHSIISSLEGTS